MITAGELLITWVIFAVIYIVLSALMDVLLAYRDNKRVDWGRYSHRVVYVLGGGFIYGAMVASTLN